MHDLVLMKRVYTIILKLGPARQVDRDLADSELEPSQVKEKTGEGKIWCDPANPAS